MLTYIDLKKILCRVWNAVIHLTLFAAFLTGKRRGVGSQFCGVFASRTSVTIDKYYIYYIDIISAHFEPA